VSINVGPSLRNKVDLKGIVDWCLFRFSSPIKQIAAESPLVERNL
jgi:hypothetical protein